MIDHTHPAVEAAITSVRRAYGSRGAEPLAYHATALRAALPHLTADDLPNRLLRDIQARTLRAAARAATYEEDGIPWDHDWDRATVSAWLEELADNIEGETNG